MKIIKFFAVVLLFTFGLSMAFAQPTAVTTPYSMYGYGIIGDRATSMQRQMGSVGYAMNSGRQINPMNPASYAAIDSLTFLFDIGANISFINSKEDNLSENSIGGGLDYITMQFPLSKYMGASIGLLPYSSVGYSFGSDIVHGTKSNQGSGGINEAYVGVAGTYAGVALGINVSYNFGNIRNDIYSRPGSTGNSLFEHMMEIRDWNVNIGLQYTARWQKIHKLTIGAVYSPKKSMHGKTYVTIQELQQDSRADTLGYMNLKGNYYQPATFGGGISYTYERTWKLMVEADFTFQQWSKAAFPGIYDSDDSSILLFQGMEFNDRYSGAVGAELVPRTRGSYFQRVAYRLGANYTRDYLNIAGNQVKDFSLSAGLGFPTPEGKTLINLGVQWKLRKASPQSLIRENYFLVTLGVNFNELWFWQRKIQ